MSDRGHPGEPAGVRGLTTRGRCLVAGGVAAVICAFVLDERDLLRVGVVATALPLLAIAITALRGVQLTGVHQIHPERLQPGTQGTAVLVVGNTGTRRTPALEISEPAVPGLTAGMRYLIAPIRTGSFCRIVYPVQARRRGRFQLGPPHVRIGDPFDLWEDHRTLDARTELLVVPNVVALTGMPNSSGARSAASGRAAFGTVGGDPDIGVRPYRSGDDIRTIHWRASARHDDLMVRLEEPVSHGGATILLDSRASVHRGADAGSSLETAVVLAASVSLHLLDSDHQVRLVSHRGAVLAQGHDISDDVLAGLAVLQADPAPLLRPQFPGNTGLLIAILGQMTVADAHLLAASRPASVNAVAIVLAADEWDTDRQRPAKQAGRDAGSDAGSEAASGAGSGAASDAGADAGSAVAVNALRAANWRVVVVRPFDDLAAVWRRACSAGDGYAAAPVGPALTDRRPA